MDGLTPIETWYASCRFRSRLEARWAVFFDTLRLVTRAGETSCRRTAPGMSGCTDHALSSAADLVGRGPRSPA